MWTCPKCGAHVEPAFEVCWKCGTTAEGVEDPGFLTADESGPIDDIRVDLEGEPPQNPLAELPDPPVDLVVCYRASNVMEAQFLADLLIERQVPAVVDGESLLGAGLAAAPPCVRVRREDLPKAGPLVEEFDRRQRQRRNE